MCHLHRCCSGVASGRAGRAQDGLKYPDKKILFPLQRDSSTIFKELASMQITYHFRIQELASMQMTH